MRDFTHDDLNPSEKTLRLIRQIAYTYRLLRLGGENRVFCLN